MTMALFRHIFKSVLKTSMSNNWWKIEWWKWWRYWWFYKVHTKGQQMYSLCMFLSRDIIDTRQQHFQLSKKKLFIKKEAVW